MSFEEIYFIISLNPIYTKGVFLTYIFHNFTNCVKQTRVQTSNALLDQFKFIQAPTLVKIELSSTQYIYIYIYIYIFN